MNIFITIAILLVNLIAFFSMYHFVKPLSNKQKIIVIVVGIAINYIMVMIVYALSSIGIDSKISNTASNFILFVFVPINSMINVPFIANSYCKYLQKKLPKDKLRNRVIIVILITAILMVGEYFYFQNIQTGVANMMKK